MDHKLTIHEALQSLAAVRDRGMEENRDMADELAEALEELTHSRSTRALNRAIEAVHNYRKNCTCSTPPANPRGQDPYSEPKPSRSCPVHGDD